MMKTSKLQSPFLKLVLPLLVTVSVFSGNVFADDYSYIATTDFADINAGEVPYYVDDPAGRNVLGINAAVIAYREKFARATRVFDGNSGIYDVTITALGEIDGEGEFRFLVNGVVVGTATNQPTAEDWGEQQHFFDDISIDSGDSISVESNALSNGLIPENGEFAFARGRWRSIGLDFDADATASGSTVDLDVQVVASSLEVNEGEQVIWMINVSNLHAQTIATGVEVSGTFSNNVQIVSAGDCSVNDSAVTCSTMELTPGAQASIEITTNAFESGSAMLDVSVTSSQADADSGNNTAAAASSVLATGLPDVDSNGIPDVLAPIDGADTTGTDTSSSSEEDMSGTGSNELPDSSGDGIASESTGGSAGGSMASSGQMSWVLLIAMGVFYRIRRKLLILN